MGILHDDEEDLRAELATVKADLQRLAAARNALEDAYNVAWGAGIETHLPICDVINKLLSDRELLTKERDELQDQLAAAESERDRYLTRACVAEAKVAKVREIEDEMMRETPAVKSAVDMAWCKLLHTYATNILTAIGGKS